MLLWRWKHLIPHDEVRAEIDKLKTSVKKEIFAEWSCIKATSHRSDNGLYRNMNVWEVKLAEKFPMRSSALTEYIMTKILAFNYTRPDFKDLYLCPYACHEHIIHNTPWMVKDTGIQCYVTGDEVRVSGPHPHSSCQVLDFCHLEKGDHVLQVVKNDYEQYELPTDIVVGTVDDCDRVVDLISDRHIYSVNRQFILLPQRVAENIANRVRERIDRRRNAVDLNQRDSVPSSFPSVGGDRIIDLGGL